MKNITLTLLAAAAIGAISIGSATAMPFNSASPTLGENDVQNVRLVCYSNGRCYNTRRSYRSAPRYYAPPGYYNGGYYGDPGYGYYGGPRVGIGFGPFGFGVW
jgi:hypothetical protein